MPIPKKETAPPQTARERVYTELKQWIIDGTLKPEEKLSDQEISQYFSVSRTPVREALQLLADQHLINIYPGSRTMVAPIDDNMINSVYRIAASLHSLAVTLSYPAITAEEHLQSLREYNRLFTLAVQQQDNTEATHYDQLFHDTFIRVADNCFLSDFLKTLDAHIQRTKLVRNPKYSLVKKGMEAPRTHEQIIEALEQHNPDLAAERMKHNWLYVIEFAEQSH